MTFRTPSVGDSTSVHTTQKNPLGAVARGVDGSEWIYLKGVASCVQGSAVTYDDASQATLSVTGAKGPVAIAGAAVVASTFGWFCISGAVSANFNAAAAAGAKLYSASTGKVDDAVVAGDQITNANVGSAAVGAAGLGTVVISRPFMNGLG